MRVAIFSIQIAVRTRYKLYTMPITSKTPKVPFPVPHDLADDIRVSIKITFFNFKLGVLIATAF